MKYQSQTIAFQIEYVPYFIRCQRCVLLVILSATNVCYNIRFFKNDGLHYTHSRMHLKNLSNKVPLSVKCFDTSHEIDDQWHNQHENKVEKQRHGLCNRDTLEDERCDVGERNNSKWIKQQCIDSISQIDAEVCEYHQVHAYDKVHLYEVESQICHPVCQYLHSLGDLKEFHSRDPFIDQLTNYD